MAGEQSYIRLERKRVVAALSHSRAHENWPRPRIIKKQSWALLAEFIQQIRRDCQNRLVCVEDNRQTGKGRYPEMREGSPV